MNELQIRAAAVGLPLTATIEQIERAEREVSNLKATASFVPASLNEENRTIDVIVATETPVRMYSWEDGPVNEILSMNPDHIRTQRVDNGAPVLDNHNRADGTKSTIGTVENWRIENGVAVATLRFSKRKDVEENQWLDIKDGILRGISVGYRVYKYEITKEDGILPEYRAVDWEPFEVSVAPVQADPNAQVRNNSENKKIQTDNKTTITMNELEKRAVAAGLPQTATVAEVERAEREIRERNEKAINDAVEAERVRSAEITEAVRKAGLKTEFAEKLIKDKTQISEARAAIIDEMAKTNVETQSQNRSAGAVGTEQSEKVRTAVENAIEHRANPSVAMTDAGREFRGMNMLDLARFFVEQNGERSRGMSPRQIVQTAFGMGERGYMSSSDFPLILGNTINRVLRREYDVVPATFQPWTNRGTFTDFRDKTVVQLGETAKMEKVVEGGEYKMGAFAESAESYKAVKYGKIIPLTWEMIVNDDLGAFNRIPKSIATQAKLLQNELVYGILSANANLSDGVALFHANHGNLAGAGAAISTTTLQSARTAIRTQKGVDGKTILNLIPKYLVCGPTNEQTAYQYTSAQYVPTKNSDINPVYNTQLQVIIDPRITGNEWYLIADPAQIDTVEYSFLDAEGELFTERKVGFEVDGLQIKSRMVFNAKAIDFRGMYKNPGA
jgi:hypothetical protein